VNMVYSKHTRVLTFRNLCQVSAMEKLRPRHRVCRYANVLPMCCYCVANVLLTRPRPRVCSANAHQHLYPLARQSPKKVNGRKPPSCAAPWRVPIQRKIQYDCRQRQAPPSRAAASALAASGSTRGPSDVWIEKCPVELAVEDGRRR
jgi:hypothetical protein